jgi:ribonuclease Z
MDLYVTLVGTSASVPTAARGTAATLISRGGERWLVDCGEGTQRQLLRSGLGLVDLDLLLITHLHGDHYLGLPGLLKTYGLRDRDRRLRIVGPRGLVRLLEVLRPVIGRTPFPLEVDEIDERYAGVAAAGDGYRLEHLPSRHTVPSLAFALVEDERPGAFDVAAARGLGVEPGPDFGVLQRGGEVVTAPGRTVRPADVLGPPRAGRTVVVTGDTEPCAPVLEAARGAAVLVHEATFLEEDRDRARETRHSTAREAAALARAADVGLLVLTHLSTRHAPREVREEAELEFARVLVPRDFDQVEVPFPERGGPIVHAARAGARRGGADAPSEARATVARIDL